jgi:hypothetical protein
MAGQSLTVAVPCIRQTALLPGLLASLAGLELDEAIVLDDGNPTPITSPLPEGPGQCLLVAADHRLEQPPSTPRSGHGAALDPGRQDLDSRQAVGTGLDSGMTSKADRYPAAEAWLDRNATACLDN